MRTIDLKQGVLDAMNLYRIFIMELCCARPATRGRIAKRILMFSCGALDAERG
jgi:hypothetical protein